MGGFVLLSFFIFLLSGALWGALFFYKKNLNEKIVQMDGSLQRQKASFEMDTLSEIVDLSKKIKVIGDILAGHKAVSGVFDFLQDFTVREVRFNDLSYTTDENGNPSVTMSGVASDYKALAAQAAVLEKNTLVKNVLFSNLGSETKGGAKFMLKMSLDPSVVKGGAN